MIAASTYLLHMYRLVEGLLAARNRPPIGQTRERTFIKSYYNELINKNNQTNFVAMYCMSRVIFSSNGFLVGFPFQNLCIRQQCLCFRIAQGEDWLGSFFFETASSASSGSDAGFVRMFVEVLRYRKEFRTSLRSVTRLQL